MAAHLARLVTVVLLVRAGVMAGSEETLQRVKRDDDSGETSSSASKCPCTRGCCEQGWFQYGNACFKPILQQKTWDDAEDHCVAREEAHLASILSSEEDHFILHLMENGNARSYWLGAKRIRQGEELRWTWTDQWPFLYKRILKISAPKERENHLAAARLNNRGFVWWYQEGTKLHPFICKYFLV